MQLTYATLVALLSLLSSTAAAGTCTSSGSISWPPVGDCSKTPSKYPTTVQTCRACCMNDQPCFTACIKAGEGGLRKRNTFGEQSQGTIQTKRSLGSRAIALSCDNNEGCDKYTDGSLLCLNLGTGLYHDDVGGNGDYYSGKYTGPDGKVQTGTSAATTSRAALSSSASQATRTTSASPATKGTANVSPSSAAAPLLAPAGGAAVYLGANVGVMGMVAGFYV